MPLSNYVKTNWLERVRQYANRFTLTNVSGTTYDLSRVEGTVSQAGTPLSIANLNKIEDRLYDLTEEIITPTMSSTTTATQKIISLPSTTLKSRLDLTVAGNTTSGYDSYTKLLMFFEGADGSTTFTDQTGKTVTASGNAQIDTAQYRYGSASGLFDGTGDYLTVTDANDELDIGTQDFTIECWVRFNSLTGLQIISDLRQTTDSDIIPVIFKGTSNNLIQIQINNIVVITGVTVVVASRWYHVALSRTGTSTKLFINGNQEGSTYTDTNDYIDISNFIVGARYSTFANGLNGWLDELRVSVGIGRYTTNFIPTTLETLSTDRQIVKSVGKNLFDGIVVGLSGKVETKILSKSSFTLQAIAVDAIGNHNLFPNIKFRENTRYRIFYNFFENDDTKNTRLRVDYTDGTVTGGTIPTSVLTASGFSTDANKTIKGISYTYSNSLGITTFQDFQIQELDKTPYVYEPYTETSAVVPVELKKISSTIFDTYDANSGQHTKNVSDWVDLYGNNYTWATSNSYDGLSGVHGFYASNSSVGAVLSGALKMLKYNNKQLTNVGSQYTADNAYLSATAGRTIIFASDTDTGWDDTWESTTSFTGMTWANLIKAYMNGWKLTTANTNVASCVWTGIASGTTQSGATGYSHVIANIDTGYTPYRMMYQLATPIITNYYPNTLIAEPNGTIYTYPFVTDYDFYDTGAGVNNTAFPIESLEYVNIVDKATGALTPVDLSICTVASGGLSFTSTALTADNLVDFGYTYKDLTTVADVIYSHPTDLKATVDGNTNNIRDLDEKIEQSNTFTTLTLKEIERDSRILKIMGGL